MTFWPVFGFGFVVGLFGAYATLIALAWWYGRK